PTIRYRGSIIPGPVSRSATLTSSLVSAPRVLTFSPSKAISCVSSDVEMETSMYHSFGKWDGLPVVRGLEALKLMERLVEAPLERHVVARQDAHFLSAIVVEDVVH